MPSTDVRISGITGGGNVTVFLDATEDFTGGTYWTTPLVCPPSGIIGLGGPGSASGPLTFKGDTPYFATGSGEVSMRQVTGAGGPPGCTYDASVFRTAAMHELGHVLGLGHPDQHVSVHSTTTATQQANAVMTSSVPAGTPSTPTVDDTQAIQYYYGSVGPVPTAAFTFAPPSPAVNQTVTFTDTSTGAPTSWSWNFGDSTTSTLQNPTHSYSSANTYTVTLTASNANGPSTPVTHQVVVVGPPIAHFTFSPPSPLTAQIVTFTDTSTGIPTSWAWNFGDSSTSTLQSPTHSYASANTYTVTLTASNANGPSAPVSHQVVVSAPAPPTASFTFAPFAPVTGQTVFFTDTSAGNPAPSSWSWNFGDSTMSTLQNPSHAYSSTGPFTVTLTASNSAGPSAPVSHTVNVSAPGVPPTASFTFAPGTPTPGQTVNFTDTSSGGPTSWTWTFGDSFSAFSPNPSHAYGTASTYTVTLTVQNAFGSNSVSHNVTVSSVVIPTASFTFSRPRRSPART